MPDVRSARAPGLLQRLTPPPRKVALLRASRIGDFLCATPAFRALRAALPEAEITLITLPMLRDLALRLTSIDRVVDFPGFPGIAEQFFDARRATAFLADMQAERFDLAIQMQGSGIYSNPFMLLLGARATAGFIHPGHSPGRLDSALPWPSASHEVERLLALTTFLGAPSRGARTEFPLWPQDRARARSLLANFERPWIGLHPAARDRARRWAPERFLAAGLALRRRYGGTLALLGDVGERELAARLAAEADREAGGAVLNLVGETSLLVLGAVIARLDLLLTNDTGPAHIGYALGTPSLTVFGGASPEVYGPPAIGPHRVALFPISCRPRDGTTCPSCARGYECLERVRVDGVVVAADALLSGEWSSSEGAHLRHGGSEEFTDVAAW
jgi:ADP-heptose:LPS heptosyltransferase